MCGVGDRGVGVRKEFTVRSVVSTLKGAGDAGREWRRKSDGDVK